MPNPVVGTNVGQAYNSQEGFGRAAIYGPSRAADTYVTMRREQLAFERQQQAASAKAAAEARSKAMEKLMTQPKYYEKMADEVLSMGDDLQERGASLMIDKGVVDVFAASKDPEVRKFQSDWNNYQLAAQTSLSVKERDGKMAEMLSAKGAAEELDIETYVAENEAFFEKNSLLDIAKKVDQMPVPQSRYGAIQTIKELDLLHKAMDDGQPMTQEKAYRIAAAYVGDPTKEKQTDALVKAGVPNELMEQALASGSKDIRLQAVANTIMDMATKPPSLLDYLDKQAEEVKANTTIFGDDVKDLDAKLRARAKDIAAHNSVVYTYTDVDGLPPVTGANAAEQRKNMEEFVYRELKERVQVQKKDPGYAARLADRLNNKPDVQTFDNFKREVIAGNPAAQGAVQGAEFADGTKVESVEYVPARPGPNVGQWTQGEWIVRGFKKDDKKGNIPVKRSYYSDDEFQRALQQPWEKEKKAKTFEPTVPDWQQAIGGATLD